MKPRSIESGLRPEQIRQCAKRLHTKQWISPGCSFFQCSKGLHLYIGTVTSQATKTTLRFNAKTGLILVLAFAAILRIWHLVEYSSLADWSHLTVDNWYFHWWAQDIASGNILGDTTCFRGPLYAVMLGTLYAVTGASLWVARLFGLLVGLLTVWQIVRLGRRVATPAVGLIAGLLYAAYPLSIYFESELLATSLFTLLCVWSLVAYYDCLKTLSTRNVLSWSLISGLAIITRPTLLPAVLVLAVILILRSEAGRNWRQTVVAILIGLLLTVGAVGARNYLISGDLVPVASQGGINFYIGNNAESDGVTSQLPEPLGNNWQLSEVTHIAETETGRELTPGEVSDFWYGEAFTWISHDPAAFAGLTLGKLWRSLSSTEISNNRSFRDFKQRATLLKHIPLSFGLLLALAAFGTVLALRYQLRVAPLLVVILTVTIVTTLFFFASRFRQPLIPFYAILGAIGIHYVATVKQLNWRNLLWPGVTALLVAALSFAPLVPLPQTQAVQHLRSQGLARYHAGDFENALGFFQAVQKLAPNSPQSRLNLGTTYLRLKEADLARKFLEAEASSYPNRHEVHTSLATVYLLSQELPNAYREIDRALALAPWDVTANRALLRIAIADSGCTIDSLTAVIQAIDTRTKSDPYALYEGGVALANKGLYTDAERVLLEALSSYGPPVEMSDYLFTPVNPYAPDKLRAHRASICQLLAFVYGRTQQYSRAQQAARMAITYDPNRAEAYINLAAALGAQGLTEDADSVMSEAVRKFGEATIDSIMNNWR